MGWAVQHAQRADLGWRPLLAAPSFRADGPRVLIDEGHLNASTAGISGRYYPFARLLRADGFAVTRGKGAFTAEALAAVDVLVIANASGAAKPQFMGINLPGGGDDGDRGGPAFTAAEIAALRVWVERGGGLLLIADHAPFGAAARLALAISPTRRRRPAPRREGAPCRGHGKAVRPRGAWRMGS